MLGVQSKPIRTVLRWQLIATAAMALTAGALGEIHTGISALLGGLVSIAAGWAFAVVAALGKAGSAGGALLAVLRAEAVKIVLIVILLWLVLTTYQDVAAVVFIGAFAVTTLIFSMAAVVREK